MANSRNVAGNLVNRYEIKRRILILMIRIFPFLSAIAYAIRTILAWFDIQPYLLGHMFGLSFTSILLYYALDDVYKFCPYHKALILYMLVDNVINIIDYIFDIPVSDLTWLSVNTVLVAITLIAVLIIHIKRKHIRIFKHSGKDLLRKKLSR